MNIILFRSIISNGNVIELEEISQHQYGDVIDRSGPDKSGVTWFIGEVDLSVTPRSDVPKSIQEQFDNFIY
ncbi:hypothetical protein [Parapedobacter indicus]|nr:hypothetical protein [Parapedobacter indicus]